jgi:hypothetical protein
MKWYKLADHLEVVDYGVASCGVEANSTINESTKK